MSVGVAHTFSQREGYVSLPDTLQLEDLPKTARTRIWNILYRHLDGSRSPLGPWIDGRWEIIARLGKDLCICNVT